MAYEPKDNWRDDPGLASFVTYERKFALFPKKCQDGTTVWLVNYYRKFKFWGFSRNQLSFAGGLTADDALHMDQLEDITEAEYIVRRLIEGI